MKETLSVRLDGIEQGCAKELVLRLKHLRDQVFNISGTIQSTQVGKGKSQEEKLDLLHDQIVSKVKQL
jgi:hypothetical protein